MEDGFDPLMEVSPTRDLSSLKFAKLHSPKMKSVYWRHFGFPTNEQGRIITKQNVVCTLCHKVLTNHGNTTNLRAHLQHRHKEIFSKICIENNIKVPPRKSHLRTALKNANKAKPLLAQTEEIKLEFLDMSQDSTGDSRLGVGVVVDDGGIITTGSDDPSMLYETMVPMTYEDEEEDDAGGAINHGDYAKEEAGDSKSGILGELVPIGAQLGVINSRKNSTHFRLDTIIEEMDPFQLQDALVNMLVLDLRNVDSLYDPGMTNFIRTLSGNVVLPSEKKIEALLFELHSHKLTSLTAQMKAQTHSKPFSLGFDLWTNVESKHFLSIFINSTTDGPDSSLLNQLYCSIEYNKYTAIDTIFIEFNLQNCTAAIVNYDYDDYLKHFLNEKNIPVILSYDAIVDKCLRSVFAMPTVAAVIDEVKDVLMRYSNEIFTKNFEMPITHDDFPWTYYEMLKFFTEIISWPDDIDILVNSAKLLLETLSALAITLDTLKGEDIPHSSMISPITTKILRKGFDVSENDEEFVVAIKSTVASLLHTLVLEDHNLTITALLDPRFHRLTNIIDLGACVQILVAKYSSLNEQESYVTPTRSTRVVTNSTKKSNLEIFFDIEESSSAKLAAEETSVEQDFKRYRNEAYLGLDDSPFVWWTKVGHMYGSVRRLASLYQCVPCVVNMNFKKPVKQQMQEHQKRYMLCGSLVDAILFLNYHFRYN